MATKFRIVYKVVNADLKSARCGGLPYGVGVKTLPDEGSKLFCFDSLKNARSFARSLYVERVFIALAENAKCADVSCAYTFDISKFWAMRAQGMTISSAVEAIKGTLYADAITLLEEIVK